ncbi:GNAT family N-acetyltransferase [Gemmata sp. JC717]|uniref:GNAT family N-acetyltransferase n=1 Tax=Gemmata algarum TaxID=2975278 RepID=UPI0021BAE2C3|nr:GNAT family N-acetyltransferase [Gemmata algarum]MDY3551060.1 GNAT family N-acetyltransferase [Gemmata algarum]
MPRFDVSPAAPHELLPACRLLFNTPNSEGVRDRLLSAGASSNVFVARARGRVCAAALAQALPGAIGVSCPPRGDSPEAEDAVASAACVWLRGRGVRVCQAFALANELHLMNSLERVGFRYTTQLAFLRRETAGGARDEHGPRVSCEPVPLSDSPLSVQVREVLLATHRATLDCPELNAPRTADEIVAGFEVAPNRECRLVYHEGRCVGVLLLDLLDTDSGARDAELSYLGIVPEARGHGLGRAALAFALGTLSDAGAGALSLSVDMRNTPAARLYARLGFAEYERRGVWLATWPG